MKNSWRNTNYTYEMEEFAKEMQKRQQVINKIPNNIQDIEIKEMEDHYKQL